MLREGAYIFGVRPWFLKSRERTVNIMKIIKFLYSIALVFLISILLLDVAYAECPDEVKNAAELGLSRMLSSIPKGYEIKYGFDNREEFAKATIGLPYQMCTIHPSVIKGNSAVTDDMITSLEEWRFPVICKGQIKVLLTVAKVKGNWLAVEIGAATLASEIKAFEERSPLKVQDVNRGILRLYEIGIDFIFITDGSKKITGGLFYPIKLAGKSNGGLRSAQLKLSPSTLHDLLADVRVIYRHEYNH